jgi:hypothetical protein
MSDQMHAAIDKDLPREAAMDLETTMTAALPHVDGAQEAIASALLAVDHPAMITTMIGDTEDDLRLGTMVHLRQDDMTNLHMTVEDLHHHQSEDMETHMRAMEILMPVRGAHPAAIPTLEAMAAMTTVDTSTLFHSYALYNSLMMRIQMIATPGRSGAPKSLLPEELRFDTFPCSW